MALDPKLLEILACPQDKGPLLYFADEQSLYNPRLHRRYRVLDGDIPDLLIDDAETVDEAEHTRLTERAEREEFAVEALYFMRDRFNQGEVWMRSGLPVKEALEFAYHSGAVQAFRTRLFTRIRSEEHHV